MDSEPVVESNTRLPQVLTQLARGSAMLEGRTRVSDVDVAVALRAGRDSILPAKLAVLQAIIRGESPYVPGVAQTVVERAVEDLRACGVITDHAPYQLTTMAGSLEQQSALFGGRK